MKGAEQLWGNTSGQKYVTRLGMAFNYGNDRVYDLIKEVPGINVREKRSEPLTSHEVVISFGTTGAGQLRVPFPPGTQSVTLCSGEWNQVQVLQLVMELKRPHRTSSKEQVIPPGASLRWVRFPTHRLREAVRPRMSRQILSLSAGE